MFGAVALLIGWVFVGFCFGFGCVWFWLGFGLGYRGKFSASLGVDPFIVSLFLMGRKGCRG